MAAGGFEARCKLNLALDGLEARAGAACANALAAIGERIRARSAALAPVRSGALRASARVHASATEVRVSYGAPYAMVQHEDASLRHPNGGGSKFLSRAIEDPATIAEAEQILASALRGALKR